ncbi:hypothetical protein [Streptomyces sp. NBC_00280]|uniref:hypothetical protein n=1 Tax=Streptomyces sp. NBC_00280 TaxID=2975699 RepID=UPI0032497B01
MRCVNCADTVQDFRRLTEAEKTYLKDRILKHTRLGAYHRCARDGCLRYQLRGDHRIGGSFPEPETKDQDRNKGQAKD